MVEPSHHPEVLGTGEVLVDGRELAGEADQAAHDVRLGGDVVTEYPGHAAVGREHRREDPDNGGLAGSVRTEQPEDRACLHSEADTVEGPHTLAEGLVQILELEWRASCWISLRALERGVRQGRLKSCII